jgi:hypothetical protein
MIERTSKTMQDILKMDLGIDRIIPTGTIVEAEIVNALIRAACSNQMIDGWPRASCHHRER